MEILLLLLRLGLAGVMALAGFAKLADLEGSRKAFEGFGVPARLTRVGPIVLSIVEIAIAGLLLFPQTSWYAAVGGLALLLLFIAQMGYQLAKGNSPDCHCFGQVYSAPVSATSVLRNVVFAVPAAVLVARGQAGQGAALTDPSVNVLELGLGTVIIGLSISILTYLRKITERQKLILKHLDLVDLVDNGPGEVERNHAGNPLDGWPVGSVAPSFELPFLNGGTLNSESLKGGTPVLYVFVTANCTICKTLIPEFEEWIEELSDKVRFVFVTAGEAHENLEKFGGKLSQLMVIEKDREVAERFRAKWTPTAVLVDANGRIASRPAIGDENIRVLVDKIRTADLNTEILHIKNGRNPNSRAPLGKPAPDIQLSDVHGRRLTSQELRGKQTLVTFWSMNCPHCKEMLEELRDWEKVKGQDEPNLIVFSDGDPEAHKQLGLNAPIVIDPDYRIAYHFGMIGTPSAVLINENGIVASETAIGSADIWSLIGKRK